MALAAEFRTETRGPKCENGRPEILQDALFLAPCSMDDMLSFGMLCTCLNCHNVHLYLIFAQQQAGCAWHFTEGVTQDRSLLQGTYKPKNQLRRKGSGLEAKGSDMLRLEEEEAAALLLLHQRLSTSSSWTIKRALSNERRQRKPVFVIITLRYSVRKRQPSLAIEKENMILNVFRFSKKTLLCFYFFQKKCFSRETHTLSTVCFQSSWMAFASHEKERGGGKCFLESKRFGQM